ncbi:restriction endonuclease subunit S [Parvimonas micra]|uniref:restriction endonuclease subunit S n=1 Tax=Parvimonas micra TaxID=33033 RepID=UPI00249DCD16|nr:restriction endonuclease subunit S [Parvimonas micra]
MDETLQNVQWGEYKIGDLFEVITSKGYDAGKLNFVSKSKNSFEFIGRTKDNYGVQGFVELLNTPPNDKNTISVSQVGAVHAQIRKNQWYSSQNVFVLTPNYKELINLLVVAAIDKILINYGGYSSYPTLQTLKEHVIELPTKDGKIDFEFMDSYISELEEERISELEEERISELAAYLKVSGFDNYELSNDEKEALENLNLIQWEEKDVTGQEGIFSVKNTKNILSNDIKPNSGSTPYLCASADNNSVSSYIKYKEELKDKGNCIFIGGKTFVVSYQETDFFSNDSHNLALYLKEEDKADIINQLFMATCIRKSLSHKYSWGNSISNKKIQNDKVMLPIRDGVVDYKIMNTLISAVKKLVIKDVVIYADKKIESTKKVIHRN